MRMYLNANKPLENYKDLYSSKYFIDKSLLIESLNEVILTSDKYVCITRPRRFGKSSVADMLGAYYSKAVDSKEIFNTLNISEREDYDKYLNKYNVVNITFNEIPDNMKTYEDYINNIINQLKKELRSLFDIEDFDESDSIKRLFTKTGEKFIFIFDEWDYIFNNNIFTENQNDFLEFLRNLLKDQPYVALCYMTGVLPIKKYSSGSALNMFDEFTMLNDTIYSEYFGFTEPEVKLLVGKQNLLVFDEISEWYNGYVNELGNRLYNPRSVVKALQNRKCKSYWTNTGAMDEVLEYLKYNILEIRDDIIEMVSGEEIDIIIDEEFRAGQATPKTKEEIYSAMIVLGFLSYHDGYLKIPNKELMREFEKALRDKSFGYVSKIIENSKKMLKATLDGKTEVVEEILHEIHNSEIPIFQYNDENSLSCVVTLGYLSARDTYRVEREEKTGKGYADFTFHPRRKRDTAFILELKKDAKPEVAIKQIIEKEYVQKFKLEYSNILAVAICYSSITKGHECIIKKL
ncbi:MAG: AAA family ATPase [Sarcina sp.]